MKRRSAVQVVMWSLAATAGCSGDAAGPSTPACSSALASQVVLAIGAYTSINPASDAGCITVAANGSAVDSAEYLLVPQSASGTPGTSSPFRLQVVSLRPTAPLAAAATLAASPGQRPTALQFDLFLRHAAASRRYETPPAAAPRLGRAPALQVIPPTLGASPGRGSSRAFSIPPASSRGSARSTTTERSSIPSWLTPVGRLAARTARRR